MVESFEDMDMLKFEPIRRPKQGKTPKRGTMWSKRPGDFKKSSPRGGRRTHEITPHYIRERLFIPIDPECRLGEVEEFRCVLGDRLRHALHIADKEQVKKLLSRRTLKFARTSEQEMLVRAASVWLGRDVESSSRLLIYNKQIRLRLEALLAEFGCIALDCPAPFKELTLCEDDRLWYFHSGDAIFVCGGTERVSAFQRAFSDVFLQDVSEDGEQKERNPGGVFYAATGSNHMRKKGIKLGEDSRVARKVREKAKGYTEADWRRLMQPQSGRWDENTVYQMKKNGLI